MHGTMIQATAALRPTSSTTGDNPYRCALSMPTLWPHTRCELDAKAGQVSHRKHLITQAGRRVRAVGLPDPHSCLLAAARHFFTLMFQNFLPSYCVRYFREDVPLVPAKFIIGVCQVIPASSSNSARYLRAQNNHGEDQ
jgi:hypothetical protein